MKAALTYNLADDSDRVDYHQAINARKAFAVIEELQEELRQLVKYNNNDYNDEQLEAVEYVQKKLWELMEDRGVRLYDYE